MLTFLPPLKKVYKKAPVYFVISGGGWHVESRHGILELTEVSAAELRNNGYAVVSIDYRVVTQKGVYISDIITDCFDALRYISSRADVLEIDKNNITVYGHSAGGHLALMCGYCNGDMFKCPTSIDSDFKITSVAALSPITAIYGDYISQTLHIKDTDDIFESDDVRESEGKRTSPITYVTKDLPPTFLGAGTSDRLVFSNSSEMLYDMLKENNVTAELVLSIGGGHIFEQVHKSFEPSVSMPQMQHMTAEFVLNATKDLSEKIV